MGSKRLKFVGTVSLVAMAAVGAAQAQNSTDSNQLEEIVVTGIRGSLIQSIATKRDADAIVDAITAEDIGKFPDKNVAESLAHLPGVQIDRDFGEGERVAIRGTDPALNRTLLNGQTVASTDWFILDAPGRTFNYTMLAPDVVGQLEVYKSPEARIDEGSIGGTVILHTRKPLDMDPVAASLSVEYGYNDRSDKGDPNISGLVSWHNDAETLGVLLSYTHQEQQLRRDGFETLGYVKSNASGGPLMPNVINSALFTQTRKRDGGTATVQVKPNEKLELTAMGMYNHGTYDNFNQSNYYFNNWGGTPNRPNSPVVSNGIVTGGSYGNAGTATQGLRLLDAIVRKSTIETYVADFKATWTDDSWSLSADAGKTRSTGGTKQQYFGEFEQLLGYSFDISGKSGLASVTPQFDPKSASGTTLGFAQLRQQPTSDEETYGQLDYKKDLELGPITAILAGVKYRKHETTQDSKLRRVKGADTPIANFDGGLTPDGYLKGIDLNSTLKNWLTVDGDKLANWFETRPAGGYVDASYFDYLPSQFAVQEKIWAGYTQVNFKTDDISGNFGLRYVHTDQLSTGKADRNGGQFGPPIIAAKDLLNVQYDKSYDDFLPNANVSFNVADDVVLRLAASRVMARANYADISSYLETNNTLRTATGGNPNLNPYRANNFDLSAEYYYSKTGLVAATLFYKDIGSYIYNASATEKVFNTDTNPVTNPTGPGLQDFTVSRPRNGGSAEIRGFELIYQGDIWENIGLQASYTFSDSETADPGLSLPFSSKHAFSVTPYYEDDKFSARLTYSFRSKYFRALDRSTAVINDSYNQLDASLAYNLTEQVTLTAQAQNLLDETQYQYVGSPSVPNAAYKNGRRFFIGARYSY